MLDVAVNLTWIAPGRVGGSEEYLVRQLTGLTESDEALRLHLYCHPLFARAHPELTAAVDTSTMPVRRDSRAMRIANEHTWLAARTRSADVVHHGGGTTPLTGRKPILLTVHDLQYLKFPHYFSNGRRRYLQALMPRSVARAAIVATPSDYVRGTIIDAFGADPDDVVVVRHGIPPIATPTADSIEAAHRKYGVDGPYLAYAAITHPHKGHRLLIDLLAAGDPRLADLKLVLLGGEGPAEPELRAAIAASGLADRVIRTGRVSHADRDALLAGAESLVFPSDYEGFGAPLVEAMALEIPVVAAGHPAIVEVVGGAGIIVAAPDPDAWADAVTDARERRAELVAKGLARRAEFTVAESGRELAAAYRVAAARGSAT